METEMTALLEKAEIMIYRKVPKTRTDNVVKTMQIHKQTPSFATTKTICLDQRKEYLMHKQDACLIPNTEKKIMTLLQI